MAKAEVFILFCEDVRMEEGGKISLMGVAGPKLLIGEDSARLKALSVVAMCRIRGTETGVDASLQIEFKSDDPNGALPTQPRREDFVLDRPENEDYWVSHVFGSFGGLLIHPGMRVCATFTVFGKKTKAELLVGRQ
jgi:hypothetical protein